MTPKQRLHLAYIDAAEVFDGDIKALSVALGGTLKNAGKKHDMTYVQRELECGRLEKFEHFFTKIDAMSIEEITQCKAYAHCRFSEALGMLEELEIISKENGMIPLQLVKKETTNIDEMISKLLEIKKNISKDKIIPKAINNIRQGSLF